MSRSRYLAFPLCAWLMLVLSGCGEKLNPVEGIVTLDGQPVEGATVTFSAENGGHMYSGFTDATGRFSLYSGDQVGALPGNYKVMVIKTAKKTTAGSLDPTSDEAIKMMKQDTESGTKTKPGSPDMMKMKMGPAGMKGAVGPGATVKSELPSVYAGSASPLTAKVPPDGEIRLELKSKP